MKITVQRSGGVAGMTRTWTVQAVPPDDKDRWQPLVEACPWDAVPEASQAVSAGRPDRFTYSLRAGQLRATLPEQALTGPWRDLFENTRAAAESIEAPESP
ncbi:protealysin inhibitor emfourin [Pseudarthrobacter sp. S9]|uniref:protealysin inhibitor emfourin n=1 Tax=Pseudarthrobacter sp. S9 TaxID=3418421 RepID=UPI003D070AFB